MSNPTNTELAGYLREWASEMDAGTPGKTWLLEAANRLEAPVSDAEHKAWLHDQKGWAVCRLRQKSREQGCAIVDGPVWDIIDSYEAVLGDLGV